MALRIGFKIHRYLGQNKLKFLVHEQTRHYTSKPKYVIHPVRQLKSSTHTNFVPKKYANPKPAAVSYRDRDLQVSEYEMDALEKDLQPSAMPEYFTLTLESKMANFPEKSDLVRGRFSKSSTQAALTVPLKLPRLANPFPERLKSFPSDTVADDEKAKLMEEEVKMVARYNLQQSQEAAAYDRHQHLEHSYQPPAAVQYHEDAVGWRESAETHQLQQPEAIPNDIEETLMQGRRQQARTRSESRPRTRAARYLKTSRHIKPSNQQQQQRRFSSVCSSPAALTDLEQCDVILDRLRAQYPEYRALKKPLFVPGSPEEREFIENTLRCIAKHKQDDADAVVKRATAPFPSYSEVKTYVREPRCREIKVSSSTITPESKSSRDRGLFVRNYSTTASAGVNVSSETRPDSVMTPPVEHGPVEAAQGTESGGLLPTATDAVDQVRGGGSTGPGSGTWRATEKPTSSSRCFSTRSNPCKKLEKKKEQGTCKTMKSPGCTEPNPNKCEYMHEKTTCKKLEAPYPSYSECMGDQYEEEPSECKICPWKIPSRRATAAAAKASDSASGKKNYSTLSGAGAASGGQQLAHTKKPPCRNPFSDKKPCDFERAAHKQDEKRRKRPNQPSPNTPQPQPATKKSFCTLTTTSKHSFHTLSKSRLHSSSASAAPQPTDNMTIVKRIRGWLNSWRPGSDNIRITQSADLCAGRETYIIEIQDIVDAHRPDTAPWISSESLRPATAHHVVGMGAAGAAGVVSCAESSGKKPGKVGPGCPPPKKKDKVTEDKKKCRQRKKRKLPSCHDVGKEKPKKNALSYTSIQVNDDVSGPPHETDDQLSQKTRDINALEEPQVPGELKPQFWRV